MSAKIKLWEKKTILFNSKINQDEPTITPYLVNKKKPTKCILILPGGGYSHKADHEGKPIAEYFNKQGISCFVLNYRVAPYKFPVPLYDSLRAIKLIRFNANKWNINTNKIGILGFSAGGHLASLTSNLYNYITDKQDNIDKESGRPDFSILCYPVITSNEKFWHRGSFINLLGIKPNKPLLKKLSYEKLINKNTQPTFLWHTAEDPGVPVENSLLYAKQLSKYNIPFSLHIFPHGSHGLGLATNIESVNNWPKICTNWLKKL